MLERGCSALCNLAAGDALCKQQIVDFDGVGGIVAAMRAHPRRANVQERGCAALCQIAAGSEACKLQARPLHYPYVTVRCVQEAAGA